MATDAPSRLLSESTTPVARRLFLIWQNPESRQFIRVGVLSELVDGRYAFEYVPGAADVAGFHPLTQFPDLDRAYVSTGLPAFFVNRLMSRRRESFPAYLHSLGVDSAESDTPMELLARTGGPRATDTFHLVDDLAPGPDGTVISRFLVSGVRHVDGDGALLSCLHEGQRLRLRPEPTNEVNERAQLICVDSGEPVGYVPDWLLADLEDLQARASSLDIFAERVTPDAQPHLRLLCRIEARIAER
ncbi:HIRAN domain-containing protein [Tomitella gaofuii]|uniref:HIRAN domain-containing protein n=1 Tax=Tomitella gaofuii TaxID=2760083 RepID=UPI0015FB8C85|nr:HIRAN domain-containing protein [Tomitella gaofuii]